MDEEEFEGIRREVAYRKHILNMQFQQTKILEQQTSFTRILALATIILAITSFFTLFKINDIIDIKSSALFYAIIIILTIAGLVVLIISFYRLLLETMDLIYKK